MSHILQLILIVQNDLHRLGIESLFDKLIHHIRVTETIRSIESLSPSLAATRADVILLDDDIAEDVFSVIRKLRQDIPEIPIVVLSSIIHPRYIEMIFQSGVSGFIFREDTLDSVVVSVLQTVAQGLRFTSPKATSAMISYRAEQSPIDLNETDWQVLKLIDRGNSVKSISKALNLNLRSIYRTRSKLEAILGAPSHEHLIAAAREQGLLSSGKRRQPSP